MPLNPMQAQKHYENIDAINKALKLAERSVDQKAYCDVEGEKKLYTAGELTALIAKEEDAIRNLYV